MRAARFGLLTLATALAAAPAPAQEAGNEAGRLREYRESARDFARGLSSQRRGDLDAAGLYYRAALTRDPQFVEARVNLARVAIARGDLGEAETLLDEADALRSEYPGIAAARGLLALRRGELRRAVEELESARALAPDDPEVLVNLGAALLRRGLLAEARRALEHALRVEPDSAEALLNLALAEDRAGRAAHAAFHYRRFLQLAGATDPAREDVIERLRRLPGAAPDPSTRLPAVTLGPRDELPKRTKERDR